MLTNSRMDNNNFKITQPLKFNEIFGAETFKEKFSRKKLKYMLLNWDVYEKVCIDYDNGTDEDDYNPKVILDRYLDKAKGADFVFTKYNKSSNSKKYGRWFADGSLSIQNMPRKIRHTICKGLWIDLDFINCHPVVLEALCNHYEIECPYLHQYNTQRDELLQEIMQVEGCTRDEAKRKVLSTLNGKNISINVSWWGLMKNEFRSIANCLSSKKEYEKLHKIVKTYKKYNIEASTMNAILCYFENMCLENLFMFLKNKKAIGDFVCVLIFDGLQIEDTEYNRKLLTPELLKEASEYILSTTGFKLDVVIKELDEAIELPEDFDKTFNDTFVIEPNDDKTAAEYAVMRYGNILKKCKNRIFVKHNNVWVDNDKHINNILKNMISNLDIRKASLNGTLVYSRCEASVEKCIRFVKSDDSYIDDNFANQLFMSNIYYLAFNNGIYSFKDKKLYKYEDLPNVYFTKKITRDYVPFSQKYSVDGKVISLEDCKKLVYDKIIDPILPDKAQQKYFLMCLARALAGCFADKKWYVGQGARDCGKGVLTGLLELAFQDFVGTFKCDNFLCQRVSGGDIAKKLSWLIPLELCRLAMSSEIKVSDGTKADNVKIDGTMIKSFAGGGDRQEARQNHKDERHFKMQPTMFIFCNELPDIDPIDTKETMEGFIFKSKFMTKEQIDELGPDRPKFFKLKDDSIKEWCNYDYVIDAFTHIILEHYEDVRPPMPKEIVEDSLVSKGDEVKSLEVVISKTFRYSNDGEDKLPISKIVEILSNRGVKCITTKKINTTFKSLQIGKYGQYRFDTGKAYGYAFIKEVPQKEED